MKTKFGHLQVNVASENVPFYRDLFSHLGWDTLMDEDGFLGVGDSTGASLWFMSGAKEQPNDYDGPGVNHLGISAPSQTDVDETAAYLSGRGVTALFETPRHRPEFAQDESQTYYQVMFESPDRVLFEVVYTGPK